MEVLKLWEVETGTLKHTFGDHTFIVGSCAWFPDSERLVCGSSEPEKGICLWDCDGNEIKAWRGMRMPKVLDLAVTPDGENLICIFCDKEIRILNVGTNAERVILEEHSITSLSLSGDGEFFIVNLNSQEIHMWDVAAKWEKPMKYTGHKQSKYVIRSCFGGLNSKFIASGSENTQVFLFLIPATVFLVLRKCRLFLSLWSKQNVRKFNAYILSRSTYGTGEIPGQLRFCLGIQ